MANLHFGSAAILLVMLSSCKGASSESSEEFPVAETWQGDKASPSGMAAPADPHAGLNMAAPPDPHAGLNMAAPPDPHAGLNMQESLDPPDPSQKIDPKMVLKGLLQVPANLQAQIPKGSVLFLSARPVHPTTGESMGGPIAVEMLAAERFPIPFQLSGAQSMVAGTEFSGSVVVYARIDGDGEASTTKPGDIEGSVQASIPEDGLQLVLNQVVP